MTVIGSGESVVGGPQDGLQREEWDFPTLQPQELMPALLWEMTRESELARKDVALAKARPDGSSDFTEVAAAIIRIALVFGAFLDDLEKSGLSQIAGIVRCFPTPWLRLAKEERQRLTRLYFQKRADEVVSMGTWSDAASRFEQDKPDPQLPLKFDSAAQTTLLLTVNWRHSRTRILSTVADILKQLRPEDAKPVSERGRKDRDFLVALERLAIMRLLHHYTLLEIKRALPEAWRLYENRKWYDDRRRALKDFRSMVDLPDSETQFPRSWETKAQCKAL